MKNNLVKFAVAGLVAVSLPAFSADVKVAGKANNQFGIELFKLTTKRTEKGNKFLSPISAYLALAMTSAGAGGDTEKAMRKALAATALTRDQFNEANRELIDSLGKKRDFTLEIANALWSKKGYTLKGSFLNSTKDYYRSTAESLDFESPTGPATVNKWASEKTHGKIEKVVDKLSPDLRVLLANATYFDAKWTSPFAASSTHNQAFTKEDGKKVEVPMMHQMGHFKYTKLRNAEVASLPYGKSESARMLFIKPQAKIADFEKSLNAAEWKKITAAVDGAKKELGNVAIPSLELSYDSTLVPALKDLGMGVAFSPKADFSPMLEGERLSISEVLQKTYLKVYEEGTIAAAVTVIGVGAASIPETKFDLVLDKPYLLAIEDVPSGAILFMASILEPEGGKLPERPKGN